ncbi:ABC-2 type transport system permease protein [Gracilibacillus halotolerans]|uniref:ABC-2 type transport system permease protein n=1 Tax=Gracilibacillus halotolerans TaxID=74386 RepID=A0A841RMA8_9BACI|nr:ABC transporter permease [Gracilibacillus halotolerans]MBB6512064.1 ABC-2 type transport system permease protein [Gracilibacillus halotolerans]
MLTFLLKDLLIFWRDRKEVLIVILLPLLLVIVLSFAMGGMFDNNNNLSMDMNIGFVVEDDQEQSLQSYEDMLSSMDELTEEEKAQFLAIASSIRPIDMFEQFFNDPEVNDWMEVEKLSRAEAEEKVENGDIHAMFVIPQDYTKNFLENILHGREMDQSFEFIVMDAGIEIETLYSIIQNYADQMNLQFAIQNIGGEIQMEEIHLPEGGREVAEGVEPFTLKQYFAIAISALFSLFIISTVVSRIAIERRDRTFNRIILTNVPARNFLFGKTAATFLLSWLQVMLVFIGSHLILNVFDGKALSFWLGLILVATAFSIAIAGISTIFSSFMLKTKNTDTVDGLIMIFIILLGTLGGGFVPIYVFPAWLQQVSQWIPNGLVLSALTEWFQYESMSTLWMPTLYLVILGVVTFFIGVMLYPKRGGVR